MISYRQHDVDVAKGDLPGHPFRGNQCVDEDWQPQPGDPCGSNDSGDAASSASEVDFNVGWLGDLESIAEMRSKYERLDREMSELSDDEVQELLDYARFGGGIKVVDTSLTNETHNVNELDYVTNNIAFWTNPPESKFRDASVESARTSTWQEFEDSVDLQTLEWNEAAWADIGEVSGDGPVRLFRGYSREDIERLDYSGDEMEFIGGSPTNDYVGSVREPSYFIFTSPNHSVASHFTGERDSYGWDDPYDEPYYRAQRLQREAIEYAISAGDIPASYYSTGTMVIIDVPDKMNGEAVYGHVEPQVVLAPGFKLVTKSIDHLAIVNDVLYEQVVRYDYVPPSEQHHTDPRGRS